MGAALAAIDAGTMQNRRQFVQLSLAAATALTIGVRTGRSAQHRIPVILDTDIGDDIDDTWALMMLLRMPQFDLRLAVGDFDNPIYRARLLAKLLHSTGRTDVPVGIGMGTKYDRGAQSDWLGDYALSDYPGVVHEDGVQALIDTIKNSPDPVTLLCIGPAPNIAEALRRDPAIAENARIVGMYGSLYVGYEAGSKPVAEWNVRADPKAIQAMFGAPWDITITPLDTCGLVRLEGENYRRIYESDDPWMKTLIRNYELWLPHAAWMDPATDVTKVSSTLFDAVAVYLAAENSLVEMQDLPLRVTDDGYTVIDKDTGRTVHCATAWKNLDAFERRLRNILIG